jgi:tetratricopeptide (TPR) repeat protein
MSKRQRALAIDDFEAALRLSFDDAEAFNNLAWIHATADDDEHRNGVRAVELAKEACELSGWKNDRYITTLAVALAERGDFEAARRRLNQAIEMAPQTDVRIRAQMKGLIEAGKPYRETEPVQPSTN